MKHKNSSVWRSDYTRWNRLYRSCFFTNIIRRFQFSIGFAEHNWRSLEQTHQIMDPTHLIYLTLTHIRMIKRILLERHDSVAKVLNDGLIRSANQSLFDLGMREWIWQPYTASSTKFCRLDQACNCNGHDLNSATGNSVVASDLQVIFERRHIAVGFNQNIRLLNCDRSMGLIILPIYG